MDDELLGRQSALTEARLLYQMISDENTIEELRELIAVPRKDRESTLGLCAGLSGRPLVDRSLEFRLAVLEEFQSPGARWPPGSRFAGSRGTSVTAAQS
jgi:hypothetical protein